jgi:hypothetical protein
VLAWHAQCPGFSLQHWEKEKKKEQKHLETKDMPDFYGGKIIKLLRHLKILKQALCYVHICKNISSPKIEPIQSQSKIPTDFVKSLASLFKNVIKVQKA